MTVSTKTMLLIGALFIMVHAIIDSRPVVRPFHLVLLVALATTACSGIQPCQAPAWSSDGPCAIGRNHDT